MNSTSGHRDGAQEQRSIQERLAGKKRTTQRKEQLVRLSGERDGKERSSGFQNRQADLEARKKKQRGTGSPRKLAP